MAKPIGPVTLSMMINGEWVKIGNVAGIEIVSPNSGNVVGGSLDGALLPCGTRDGQTLKWDDKRRRWIDSKVSR